ncbi:MAG: 30S ribosomal protein S14 [Puniceicoccales bacterium]|jgi:small subunit ribosomal protein S14|nr:30S ribosomal protein S14 [Puniceicoccales bacterium]
MAKISVVKRNEKRRLLVAKFVAQRNALKKILKNPQTTDEDFFRASRKLAELPRDSSPVRVRNRCTITGRGRAYYRKFGVSRIQLRELVSFGKIPGVIKASW